MMTMLIVDDLRINREILSLYFKDKFEVLEATNGREALELLMNPEMHVDVMLLDLSMPEMSGKEFLEYRKCSERLSKIPVIIVTASDKAHDEMETFELGIDDYITKPFMPEVVESRIHRAIEHRRSLEEALKQANEYRQQALLDRATGFYNKASVEQLADRALKGSEGSLAALIVCDADKFKKVNDLLGHLEGDKVIHRLAAMIAGQCGRKDILGRIGGDEFVILLKDLRCREDARRLAGQLLEEVRRSTKHQLPEYLSISMGIAFNDSHACGYRELFAKADEALRYAKENGKNQYQEYGIKRGLSIKRRSLALLFNPARKNLLILEEILEDQFLMVEARTPQRLMELYQKMEEKIAILFVDISEEPDDGTAVVEMLRNIMRKGISFPIIAIYEEGYLSQCRNVLSLPIDDICPSPLEKSYVTRRIGQLLEKYAGKHREGLVQRIMDGSLYQNHYNQEEMIHNG